MTLNLQQAIDFVVAKRGGAAYRSWELDKGISVQLCALVVWWNPDVERFGDDAPEYFVQYSSTTYNKGYEVTDEGWFAEDDFYVWDDDLPEDFPRDGFEPAIAFNSRWFDFYTALLLAFLKGQQIEGYTS